MNQLSWLIYWAGIVDALNGWLSAFAVITFIGAVACTVYAIVCAVNNYKFIRRFMVVYPLFLFLLVTSIMIPSRDTILAIAASEMGEKVLATPQAQRVGEALMNWIEVQSKPVPQERETTR